MVVNGLWISKSRSPRKFRHNGGRQKQRTNEGQMVADVWLVSLKPLAGLRVNRRPLSESQVDLSLINVDHQHS